MRLCLEDLLSDLNFGLTVNDVFLYQRWKIMSVRFAFSFGMMMKRCWSVCV